jgi:ammonia channel protein AmtB
MCARPPALPFPAAQLGGVASLWGAWVLGPRIGRFDAAGNPVEMPGHNASLTLLGVFMLWFGWYGFNPGSTNALLNNASGYFDAGGYSQVVAAAAVNTTISAGAGAVFTLFTSMIHQYMTLGVPVWDLIIAGNGALAGLVGITSERARPRCRCLGCVPSAACHAAPCLRRSFLSACPATPPRGPRASTADPAR